MSGSCVYARVCTLTSISLTITRADQVIGKGSFGKVMLVRRKGGDSKIYAMKVLRKENIIKRNQVCELLSTNISKLNLHFRWSTPKLSEVFWVICNIPLL
jgi:hypothetical protein